MLWRTLNCLFCLKVLYRLTGLVGSFLMIVCIMCTFFFFTSNMGVELLWSDVLSLSFPDPHKQFQCRAESGCPPGFRVLCVSLPGCFRSLRSVALIHRTVWTSGVVSSQLSASPLFCRDLCSSDTVGSLLPGDKVHRQEHLHQSLMGHLQAVLSCRRSRQKRERWHWSVLTGSSMSLRIQTAWCCLPQVPTLLAALETVWNREDIQSAVMEHEALNVIIRSDRCSAGHFAMVDKVLISSAGVKVLILMVNAHSTTS